MGEAALTLLEGVLTFGGLLLFFWLAANAIETPERVIKWWWKKKPPPKPPEPPRHHKDFDHPA